MERQTTTITLELPTDLVDEMRADLRRGAYNSLDEMAEDMLRNAPRRLTAEEETLVREGMESGPAEPLTGADWERIHQLVLGERRGQGS